MLDVDGYKKRFKVKNAHTGYSYEWCIRTPGAVARAYRTYTCFGYGYEYRTEFTEVPGTGMEVLKS